MKEGRMAVVLGGLGMKDEWKGWGMLGGWFQGLFIYYTKGKKRNSLLLYISIYNNS
jgi:hypothetical protein